MPRALAISTAAALADELSEGEASVRVFLTAGGLAILGCVLLLFTIWWWRGTKPEPPALGPLEVMGDRRWATASDSERRRLINENRPEGAYLLEGVVVPVPLDLSVLANDRPHDFDDLREPVAPMVEADSEHLEAAQAELEARAETDETDAETDETDAETDAEADETEAMDEPALDAAADRAVELQPASSNDPTQISVRPSHAQPTDAASESADRLMIDPLLQRTATPD